LKEAVDAAAIDLVFACGPNMKLLFDEVKPAQQGAWAPDSGQLAQPLLDAIAPGDAVMIKGSLASKMAPLVQALLARYPKAGG
jgi:UDP-N-acetylmuramoyl-tripeptide--D-alanyl-D-alanine ligase